MPSDKERKQNPTILPSESQLNISEIPQVIRSWLVGELSDILQEMYDGQSYFVALQRIDVIMTRIKDDNRISKKSQEELLKRLNIASQLIHNNNTLTRASGYAVLQRIASELR